MAERGRVLLPVVPARLTLYLSLPPSHTVTTMIRRLLPLSLLFALVFVGCDTTEENGGGDTFPLPSDVSHEASFVFTAGILSAGDTYIESQTQLSQPVINDSRFDPADIASARIASGSVELQIDFPGGQENEIMIDEATLTLDADGVGEQVVARGQNFSLAILTTNAQLRREILSIVDGDITPYLQEDSFTGTLTLDVAGAGEEEYQFTVTFDVEATVNAVALPPATL